MIIGIIFQSLQTVYEEKLLSKIETSTYRFVGLKGFFGFFFVIMAQIFFLFVFMCCEPASKAGMFFQSINAGASMGSLMKSNELSNIIHLFINKNILGKKANIKKIIPKLKEDKDI